MKTPPKSRFLLLFAFAVLALGGPSEAASTHRAHPRTQSAAATAPQPGPATPEPAKAAPAAADSDVDDEDNPDENGVAAVVNETPITEYDVRQRLALVLATSGSQPSRETVKRMRPQVLDQLKTESLELQEARRKNISVSPQEVDKEIDGILNDNHLTMDQLKQILGHANVAIETLRAQIAIQLAWQKAIEDEYGDRINITDQDVAEELAREKEGADKPHYLVAEIFLPVDSPEQNEKVLKDANDLENQLRNGASFPQLARQFSQSPSAAAGGDLGWVHDGQLAAELNDELRKTTPGQLTPPIRGTGGYYILALRQRQEGVGVKLPAAPPPPKPEPEPETPAAKAGYLPLARFLLPMPPKAPKDYLDKAIQMAQQIRAGNPTCAMLEKIHEQIKGSVYMSLGTMRVTDLGPEIRAELAKTASGEATPPFRSSAGIEIIGRCDKQAPRPEAVAAAPAPSNFRIPTPQEIEGRLFQQQISALARRYIRDLRRQANVETR